MPKRKAQSIKSLPNALRKSFDKGQEQVLFATGANEYLFLADYDEKPLVKGWLLVANDDSEWVCIDDAGEKYLGEEPPEPWCGLPTFIAEKNTFVAGLHSLKDDE